MPRASPSASGRLRFRASALALLVLTSVGCGGGGDAPPVEPPLGDPQPLSPLLPDGRTRGSVDFLLDAQALADSWVVVDRTFLPSSCAVQEGTIGSAGTHRLLLFDTRITNLGELDLHVGDPAQPLPPLNPADFEYHDCHGHLHLHGYAAYELRRLDGSLATLGTKAGFCMLDNEPVHPAAGPRRYDCDDQGLSSGWADVYQRTLDGQWLDVTGLPAGDYLLVVTINAEGNLPEAVDVYPNTASVAVRLPDPGAPVAQPDDHGDQPSQATQLAFPSGIVAELEEAGDADWFRVSVTAGIAYTFFTELQTLGNSALRLTTVTGGSVISANDDVVAGTDPSSRIQWTATFTGAVALEVTGPGGSTGAYRIVVE